MVAIERVGVWIDQNHPRMAADDPFQQRRQSRVFSRKLNVGPNLRRRIAQPHRIDVAGDHECVRFAFQRLGKHRSVEGIWKTSLEHRAEHRVGDPPFHAAIDVSIAGLEKRRSAGLGRPGERSGTTQQKRPEARR